MKRLAHDEIFMGQALIASGGSTCCRRQVGCVLVDEHNYVIGVGRNGTPKGMVHCIDKPCKGAHLPSGQGLDVCEATHAETNALLQCKDVQRIKTCYTTTAPCIHCIKLLMNTSCERIVFLDLYPGCEVQQQMWVMNASDYDRTWKALRETAFLAGLRQQVKKSTGRV